MRVLLVALMLAMIALAGCTEPDDSMSGGDGDGGAMDNGDGNEGDADGTAMEPQTHTVQAGSGTFTPSELTIHVGDTVRFEFSGTHTATSDDGTTFDSGSKSSGQTFEWTPEEAGDVPYHCSFHGSPGSGMHGTIIVEA